MRQLFVAFAAVQRSIVPTTWGWPFVLYQTSRIEAFSRAALPMCPHGMPAYQVDAVHVLLILWHDV